MKFTDKELILFDLDGTLIDSAPDLSRSVNYMLRTSGRSEFSDDIIHSWVGNGASTLVKRALSGSEIIDENIENSLFEEALNIFLNYYKQNSCVDTVMYPNVKETLFSIKEKGYKLAIITNKPYGFIDTILQTLGIDSYFSLCLGGDSLEQRKPHPLPLLHACKILDVRPENSLMIGDSKNDILAAQAAKIDTVGVSYGYNYGEDISLYKPDVIVDNFANILKTLP
ncbi:phosphoglycolate phosphatase [Sulfurimonas sp.]|nr:phosphoglycolate phosphatase [Sulfurimonas sp.]